MFSTGTIIHITIGKIEERKTDNKTDENAKDKQIGRLKELGW